MESSEQREIEEKVREIMSLIRRAVPDDQFRLMMDPATRTEEGTQAFVESTHQNWKKAQDLILDAILKYEAIDSAPSATIPSTVALFRGLADSIAWIIFGLDRSAIRRFIVDGIFGKLKDQNYQSVKELADEINKDPSAFALMCDISNSLGVGDLLIVRSHQGRRDIEIAEVKEGSVNQRIIRKLRESKQPDGNDPALTKHERAQLKRILRQKQRTDQVIEALNSGEGTDHRSGQAIKISSTTIRVSEWDEILRNALTKKFGPDKENYHYQIIQGILHIGIYDNVSGPFLRGQGEFVFKGACASDSVEDSEMEEALKKEDWNLIMAHADESGLLLRATDCFLIPGSLPLYLRSIPDGFILDFIFGRKSLLTFVNLRRFVECLKSLGLGVSFKTGKSARRLKAHSHFRHLLFHGDRSLVVEHGKYTATIGPNAFQVVLTDGVLPLSLAHNLCLDVGMGVPE